VSLLRGAKLLVHQETGARLSGVMGKGKGEAWAPVTLFISHIVVLSRLNALREHVLRHARQTRTPLVLFA
jgi:hypothetical protein